MPLARRFKRAPKVSEDGLCRRGGPGGPARAERPSWAWRDRETAECLPCRAYGRRDDDHSSKTVSTSPSSKSWLWPCPSSWSTSENSTIITWSAAACPSRLMQEHHREHEKDRQTIPQRHDTANLKRRSAGLRSDIPMNGIRSITLFWHGRSCFRGNGRLPAHFE